MAGREFRGTPHLGPGPRMGRTSTPRSKTSVAPACPVARLAYRPNSFFIMSFALSTSDLSSGAEAGLSGLGGLAWPLSLGSFGRGMPIPFPPSSRPYQISCSQPESRRVADLAAQSLGCAAPSSYDVSLRLVCKADRP